MTKAKLDLLFYFVDHLLLRPEGKQVLKDDILACDVKKQELVFGRLFRYFLDRENWLLEGEAEFLESEIKLMKK